MLEPLQETVAEMLAAAQSFEVIDDAGRWEASRRFQRQFLAAMADVVPLVGLALFSQRDGRQEFFTRHIEPLFGALAEAIDRAMQTRAFTRLDPRVVAVTLAGAYFGYSIAETFGADLPDVGVFADVTTDQVCSTRWV